MSGAANSRQRLYLGFGAIASIQALTGCTIYWLPGAWLLWFGIGAVATIAIGIAALYAAQRGLEATRSHSSERLVLWLDDIDLNSHAFVFPDEPTQHTSDNALIDAVERLGARVHSYREKLLARHQRVQRLLRSVTDVLYHTDADGRLTWVSDSVRDMLGYTAAQLEGRLLSELLVDPEQDFPTLIESTQLRRHPTRVRRSDGQTAWLLVSSRRINNAQGRAIGSEGILRDGTRLIETQRALDQEKERAHVTLAAIGDGVITTDAHGKVEYLNPRARELLGLSAADPAKQDFDALCRLVDGTQSTPLNGIVAACVDSGEAIEWGDDLKLRGAHGQNLGKSVKVTISPLRDASQEITGTVVALHDVTRLQQITQEMAYQANHDLITGLPNRRAFETRLLAIQQGSAVPQREHAVCYLDLDQFKLVNDTCGHDAGDEMLRQIAALMAARLRASDTVARLGGDEFGVIMENVSITVAQAKADILRNAIDTFRFRWQDKQFRLGASIGLVAVNGEAVNVTELLRRADTACYMAKEKGRNQVYVYHGDSDETQTRHSDMERMQQISDALDNNRFMLYGQIIEPLEAVHADRVGVELLLRMQDRNASVRGPQNYLITAERYNAAPRIDRWVLARALSLIEDAGHHAGRIDHYSINFSGQSISDKHFVDFARELIESSNVDPERLVFEITETTAVTNTQRARQLIESLRELGCRFSLDDFGSGLSSFSYLKDLPSDFIKIDGKLVQNVLHDRVESSIVQAINQVGQAMGLKTVAEHVDSRALLDALRRIGVDYVQGFYVARPIAFERITEALDRRDRVGSATRGLEHATPDTGDTDTAEHARRHL